ncbi:hypothetical protein [Kordia sp.]|uniref:hypothetical protein n=1 Tax=Kordia sp. TaxID=1965332 RepID=UPI003D6B0371
MKNNRNDRSNRNTRSLDLNKKSISRLNEETVKGGRAECSVLVRDTEICITRDEMCPTRNEDCELAGS